MLPLCSFLSSDCTFEIFFACPGIATWFLFPAYLGILCFVYVAQLKGTIARYNLACNADIVKIRFYEIFRPKQCFHEIKMHLRNVRPLFEIQQQELKMHFLGFFSLEKSVTNPFIRGLVQKSDKS